MTLGSLCLPHHGLHAVASITIVCNACLQGIYRTGFTHSDLTMPEKSMHWHAIRSRDTDIDCSAEYLNSSFTLVYQQAIHSKLDVQLHGLQAPADE